jgi:hypothetical protein
VPLAASGDPADRRGTTGHLWDRVVGPLADARGGHEPAIHAAALRAFTLDRQGMGAALSDAPQEFTRAAESDPLELSLPTPAGGFQRFELQESPVMEPGLAALHPEITTYSGEGIDDPTATIRADLTPVGFHASVRGALGSWYIDPYYHRDQGVYASYFVRDLEDAHLPFPERGPFEDPLGQGLTASDPTEPEAVRSSGDQLRTYRLALVTDQTYATYHGAANVTAAKVTLVNRVTQIYEDETSIRMVLVANNDLLNLNTDALAIQPNGPCGGAACYTAAQLNGCTGGLLSRNRIVIGQIIGASNYDIGHIGLGKAGGGVANLGVVGGNSKAGGCTGLPTPVGDFFAVDYVAHEMGHQYAGNHTFNGTQHNCSGANRNPPTSVEPGSGSSIMAYAGICRQDDLQPHSDPYWSQESFDEIVAYVTSSQPPINEVQNVSLVGFDGTDSFKLTYNAGESPVIQRGTNYTTQGITQAILAIPGWPAGAVPNVTGFAGATTPGDTGFQVTFTGTLAATNAAQFGLTALTGASGFVGETAKGGPIDNQGSSVTATGNTPPTVTAPTSFTIPYRTPFALTGSATDPDAGDTLTYMWEQDDPGAGAGTALVSPTKTNGPLFRQFGERLEQPPYDPNAYPDGGEYVAPGENALTTDPTRVFPDMAQVLANNTNAETGDCPGPPIPPPPTSGGTNVPAPQIDCYSEFLPTPGYSGPMHFRLTARDGNPAGGGVNSDDTLVTLAPGTGPFLVTSPNTAVTYETGSTQTVTWDVAGTATAPVGAANVSILLSTDGGATFPHVLTSATANDGSQQVALPSVNTTQARIQVKAVGNVFFDVSNSDFTVASPPAVTNDAPVGLTTQHGEALPVTVTISATDPDSEGIELAATPSGLPDGMSLAVDTTSAASALPGTRTWTVTGNADDAPGTYPVTVEVSDGGLTDTTQFQIEVTKADQTIDFAPLDDKAYGDPDFDVHATASSGLPVTFSVGAGDECTISGNTVHLTGPGACTVTASQAGDENYNAAPSVPHTFTIHDPSPTDLSLSTSSSARSVEVGRSLTYSVVVRNEGPSGAAEVQLSQSLLTGGIALTTGTARAEDCARLGDQVTCDVGLLESGQSATYRFTIVPSAPGQFANVTRVTAVNDDANAGNDTATVLTQVDRARCTITGTSGSDRLRGTSGRDVICARGGADMVKGGGGDDVITGGARSDKLRGGAGIDVVRGSGGKDGINVRDGAAGNDAALGDRGRDACVSDPNDVVVSCP